MIRAPLYKAIAFKQFFQNVSTQPQLNIFSMPIGSMYGIFPYIYHTFKPDVGTVDIPYMDPMGWPSTIVSKDIK